jgi:hypothetical protein
MQIPEINVKREINPDRINGRMLADALESQQAALARTSTAIEHVFKMLFVGNNFKEAFAWMSQQHIEPVRQILIILAITGWALADAKMVFDQESDYWNRAEEAFDQPLPI